MRLVIEVEDPEIVVQLRSAGKTVPSTGSMPKAEGAEPTEVKDAGAAPPAPPTGPLVNISQMPETAHSDSGKQLPAASEIQTTSGQPKSAAVKPSAEVPMIDAGTPPADLLSKTPMRMGREN